MSSTGISGNVHEYGTTLDGQKNKVRCNYCAKVVSGFSRLKHHLGRIRGDVAPCEVVPENVKAQMRNNLLDSKNKNLTREVLQLFSSDTSGKREFCSNSSDLKDTNLEYNQSNGTGKRKHAALDSVTNDGVENNIPFVHSTLPSSAAGKSEELKDNPLSHVQRCIGRFFYENGIDSTAANSTSFLRMIDAVVGCASSNYNIPSSHELRGRILKEEMEVIHRYVKDVKHSWGSTGCSILLDGWTNDKGQSLINFLVDCPRGPIFLRSADISDFDRDVSALISLLDGVIEEVGVENVTQVVTYSTSGFMAAVGKKLVEKYRTIFWTVCGSHCIDLMLEKIGTLAPTKRVLDKAKTITKFIYSRATVLKLMRIHCHRRDLVSPSRIRSAMSFLTLENIVSEKENLKSMFDSFTWNNSMWASTTAGKRVADLVGESSFWSEAKMALNATIPLVRALQLINGGDSKPQVGYIYETIDQAKETIKKEFKYKKAKYLPLWEIIDEIWDNHLHSPLHSAGYYFNPSFFYSSDFLSDAEVASGLLCCIVRMVEDRKNQDLISLQMDEYRAAKGGFGEENAVEQRTEISPAIWWALYGGQCPELQRFAIRILSQTCSGGLRYDLRRSLSERLHTQGRNNIEQQRLNDLTFVHHNLELQRYASVVNRYTDGIIMIEDFDPTSDWVVEERELAPRNDNDSGWMDSDGNEIKNTVQGPLRGDIPSSFTLKEEPV